MIQTLLQREPNGSWTLPSSSISRQMESRLKSLMDKCDQALAPLGDIQGVTNLKNRIQHMHQAAIEEVNRNALAVRIIQVALSAQALKSINPNPPLVEEGVDRLLDELTQAIGEVPAADRRELLLAAAQGGHKEVVELLLNEGTQVNAANNNGPQPLHVAALDGQKEVVKLLLRKGADVNARSSDGCQPLHCAASGGHKEIVELLLNRGAHVNAADKFGLQPLHVAAMKGDKKMVEILLSKGANVDAADSDGKQPLNYAEYYKHKKVENLLLRKQNLDFLLKVYREKGYLTRFLDKKRFPIDKSYINLAIVDQENFEDTERKTRKLDRFLAESALFDKPKCVDLSQLFDSNPRVYIEGDAGSGKSTLCQYLAYNWAVLNPEVRHQAIGSWLNQYEAVIWIPLREILTLSNKAKLSDLFAKLYPGLILDKLDPGRTLYILDSFDEVASLEDACKDFVEDQRWEIVKFLIDRPQWLMTSRPGLFSEKFSMCRRLKNLGFTENNIRSYIQRFSEDFRISGNTLEKAVFASNDLKNLAHIPLYLELVCSLWKDNSAILGILSNPIALYDAMVVYLFRRHIERLQMSTAPILNSRVLNHKDVLLYRLCLEKIAFISRQLGSNRVTPAIYMAIFDQDPFNNFSDEKLHDFGKRLFEDLGLLARRGDAKQLFDQDYAFLHPTFEEYFAARHVASAMESSEKLASGETAGEWLEVNRLLKEKEVLIDFVAGLAKSERQLNVLADRLIDDPKREIESNSWQYPLHRSAFLGLLSLTKILLTKGVRVDSANKKNSQPLHMAASNGHKEVVELLLQKGAKVDASDNDGWQAMSLAAYDGHKEVVVLLLEKGAKVDPVANDGTQPLHTAAMNGHKEIVELLLKKGAKVDAAGYTGWQSLHVAAQNGQKEIVELLIERGAKFDAANNNGAQPLLKAAQNGHKEIVELLLEKGAQIGAVDKDGWQPILWATLKGYKEVVELLLQKGARIDATSNNGLQPLLMAADQGRKEILELLLINGAKVDAANNDGWQPLHSAAMNGHEEVVELLIEKGAEVDAADNDGWQPVHAAAMNGQKEIVELLLEKGAKVNATNNDGTQLVHAAAMNGHIEIVELLLEKGAKVDATNNDGTQLVYAAALDRLKERKWPPLESSVWP